MSTKSPYSKPEYFYNRELSWLLFNPPRTGRGQRFLSSLI